VRFLLVDRLLQIETGKSLVAAKCVALSEDYFADHFPGFPVMPGSLILEGFEQASHLLMGVSSDFTRAATLRRVSRGSFRRLVRPGDRLLLRVSLARFTETDAQVQADATSDGEKVADARLEFNLQDAGDDPEAARRCRRLREFYQLLTVDPAEVAGGNWARRV
jgi:3-hydroxyacyl-[acyl-carrier-protein] dehydratase